MSFVRLKRRRGRAYGYLVENHWDASAGQPRQRVLKYLGPADEIHLSDLPKAARTPSLAARLRSAAESSDVRRTAALEELRATLCEALVAGDFPRARGAALRAMRQVGVDRLYGELIPQVFTEIGRRWASGTLSVSREHLASGVVARVVEQINARYRLPSTGHREVVLCTPEGETHTLALQLAEGLLRQKGFSPLNLGASAPTASTLEFIAERRPVAAFISATLPVSLGAARTLALRIHRRTPETRVVLGGQAVRPDSLRPPDEGFECVVGSLPAFLDGWKPGAPRPSTKKVARP